MKTNAYDMHAKEQIWIQNAQVRSIRYYKWNKLQPALLVVWNNRKWFPDNILDKARFLLHRSQHFARNYALENFRRDLHNERQRKTKIQTLRAESRQHLSNNCFPSTTNIILLNKGNSPTIQIVPSPSPLFTSQESHSALSVYMASGSCLIYGIFFKNSQKSGIIFHID